MSGPVYADKSEGHSIHIIILTVSICLCVCVLIGLLSFKCLSLINELDLILQVVPYALPE